MKTRAAPSQTLPKVISRRRLKKRLNASSPILESLSDSVLLDWTFHAVRCRCIRIVLVSTDAEPYAVSFIRLDKAIDPVQLVHKLCVEAQENPEKKRSRWIRRITPITSIRKTLSVDLEAFAKEILKPHFHSGGPPKKVSY